jgi:SPP1 family phage portal protein
MTDKAYIELIKKDGLSSDIIKLLLTERSARMDEQRILYARYRADAEGVPIKTRKYMIDGKEQRKKINNRLNTDFFGDIIDVKTGFMAGVPIAYGLDYKTDSSEAAYQAGVEAIKNFNKAEVIEDSDSEMIKMASICGETTRLLYIGTDGNPHLSDLNPWNTIVLYDGKEPVYGFYFYHYKEVGRLLGVIKTEKEYDAVEFYDATHMTKYTSANNGDYVKGEQTAHMFPGCPMFSILNNAEAQGDGEKVLSLIDAYDRLLSDWDNEIEQFRLAYMAIMGGKIEKDAIEAMAASGALSVPEGVDIKFITKQMDVNATEKLCSIIEENIYQFAKAINSRDENFAGTITGIALSYKMNPLDQKCLTMERKIITAFRYQYKLLCDIWRTRRIADINYLDVNFKFKRKYPQNLASEADIAEKLRGTVSLTTILQNLSIVENVDEELQRIAEDTAISLPAEEEPKKETVTDEG